MNNKTSNIQYKTSGQPLLSVIIPCYNCAPVIIRCLDSIDYPDCEILVVNDGSTDDSAEVVKQYALLHPNVRLINKDNGGVSSARNMGIENARGKYISFIDADDYIVKGGLGRIVSIAEQQDADVLKFKFVTVNNNAEYDNSSVADIPIQTELTTGLGVLQRFDISDYIVWDGIYRRSLILDNHIFFITDLCLHEDDTFMGMLYCHANRVVASDLKIYRYVYSSNFSSTHRQSIEKQRVLIDSGWKAASCRSQYVEKHYPEAMPLERLKYMRWVAQPKQAIEAQLPLAEYQSVLNKFRRLGVYPLDYRWIHVAHWDDSLYKKLKFAVKTFLCNHPRFAYRLMGK